MQVRTAVVNVPFFLCFSSSLTPQLTLLARHRLLQLVGEPIHFTRDSGYPHLLSDRTSAWQRRMKSPFPTLARQDDLALVATASLLAKVIQPLRIRVFMGLL